MWISSIKKSPFKGNCSFQKGEYPIMKQTLKNVSAQKLYEQLFEDISTKDCYELISELATKSRKLHCRAFVEVVAKVSNGKYSEVKATNLKFLATPLGLRFNHEEIWRELKRLLKTKTPLSNPGVRRLLEAHPCAETAKHLFSNIPLYYGEGDYKEGRNPWTALEGFACEGIKTPEMLKFCEEQIVLNAKKESFNPIVKLFVFLELGGNICESPSVIRAVVESTIKDGRSDSSIVELQKIVESREVFLNVALPFVPLSYFDDELKWGLHGRVNGGMPIIRSYLLEFPQVVIPVLLSKDEDGLDEFLCNVIETNLEETEGEVLLTLLISAISKFNSRIVLDTLSNCVGKCSPVIDRFVTDILHLKLVEQSL